MVINSVTQGEQFYNNLKTINSFIQSIIYFNCSSSSNGSVDIDIDVGVGVL